MSEIDPEILVKLLKKLSEYFDIEKLIKAGGYSRFESLIHELSELKYLLPGGQDVVKTLEELIKCSYCLEHPPDIFLNCDHNICKSCLQSKLQELDSLTSDTSKALECPCCYISIPISSYSHLVPRSETLQKCCKCSKTLTQNSFYDLNLCHNLCKRCSWIESLSNTTKCGVCRSPVTNPLQSLSTIQEYCSDCREPINIQKSFFLCTDHIYCYNCCIKSLRMFFCKVCSSSLSIQDYYFAKKFLYLKCSYCNHVREKPLFVYKKCCAEIVCVPCQVEFSQEKCLSCGQKVFIN
jgi:hypothetical protein